MWGAKSLKRMKVGNKILQQGLKGKVKKLRTWMSEQKKITRKERGRTKRVRTYTNKPQGPGRGEHEDSHQKEH